MRLSDIMGNVDLWVYPVVALVIFLGVFALVIRRTFEVSVQEHERNARLAMDEGEGAAAGATGSHGKELA